MSFKKFRLAFILADFSMFRIADFLGRRYAMVTECMMFIVGVIIQITSFSVWQQFAVGRFVSGLGVGALSAAVPMVCFRFLHRHNVQCLTSNFSTKPRLLRPKSVVL